MVCLTIHRNSLRTGCCIQAPQQWIQGITDLWCLRSRGANLTGLHHLLFVYFGLVLKSCRLSTLLNGGLKPQNTSGPSVSDKVKSTQEVMLYTLSNQNNPLFRCAFGGVAIDRGSLFPFPGLMLLQS